MKPLLLRQAFRLRCLCSLSRQQKFLSGPYPIGIPKIFSRVDDPVDTRASFQPTCASFQPTRANFQPTRASFRPTRARILNTYITYKYTTLLTPSSFFFFIQFLHFLLSSHPDNAK